VNKYKTRYPDVAYIEDGAISLALGRTAANPLDNGKDFGDAIEQVLAEQRKLEGNLSHKIGDFMGKVYPVVSLALSLAGAGADVNNEYSLAFTTRW
jgi:hypothetical protein